MAISKMVKIDGEKLCEQITQRGLTQHKMCAELGVNSSYFSNARSRGQLAALMTVTLESRFGIPKDTYVIEEKEEVKKEPVTVESPKEINMTISSEVEKQLYKIIYSAVYEAVKKAWAE